MRLAGGAAFALALCVAGLASAQDASPMGQGQANINVRSDVTLGIEGARSTPSHRLQQIAEAATDQMPNLRKCYRELSAKRPTAAGAVAVRVSLEAGSAPATLELKVRPGTDAEVARCVQSVLSKAGFRKVERPAAAVLSLEFDNSRAKGEQAMVERQKAAEQVAIQDRTAGGYEARWAADDGKVAFRVANPSARDGIESTLVKLREGFAGFADCRRRSEQGGKSPAGSLVAELRIAPKVKAQAKVLSSSVAHPRAIPCVERALHALRFEAGSVATKLELEITFGPASSPTATP